MTMQNICRSALVPFSTKQMYQLVDDIDNYNSFVPYCQTACVLERNPKQVTAKLEVAKNGLAKSFTTVNTLKPYEFIRMELIDGPFSHLSGSWRFTALSESACKIELDLNFEFSNKITRLAFSKIFNKLIQSMVSAFTAQAEKIYVK